MELEVLFLLLNCVLAVYAWHRHKDIYNPLFITAFVWFSFVSVYEILSCFNNNLRDLSVLFYVICFCYVISFSVIYLLVTYNIKLKYTINKEYFKNNYRKISTKTLNIIITLAIISNLYYIFTLCSIAESFNPFIVMSTIRSIARDGSRNLTSIIKLPSFLFNFTPLILCYVLIYQLKIDKKRIVILILEMFLISMLLATKGRLIRLSILIIILLNRALPKRKFRAVAIIIIPISMALLYMLIINRDRVYFENHTFFDYIYLYLLSPLPALDRLVTDDLNFTSSGFGARTFSYIYTIFYRLMKTPIPRYSDPGYVIVPSLSGTLTTNVETVVGSYYMDFGLYGAILCGLVYGVIFGYSYKKMAKEKRRAYTIFYLLNFPYLLFQTFGDFITPTISMTIQEFLCALLLIKFSKKFKLVI